jgi:hypothetical protein
VAATQPWGCRCRWLRAHIPPSPHLACASGIPAGEEGLGVGINPRAASGPHGGVLAVTLCSAAPMMHRSLGCHLSPTLNGLCLWAPRRPCTRRPQTSRGPASLHSATPVSGSALLGWEHTRWAEAAVESAMVWSSAGLCRGDPLSSMLAPRKHRGRPRRHRSHSRGRRLEWAGPPPPGAAWMQRGVSGWQWWGCHAVHAELPPAQRLHPAGPRSELCDEAGSVVRAIVGVLGPQAACCCAAVAPETSQSGATGGGGGWHRGTAWLGGGDGGSCCWGSPPCPSPAELLARGDERCGAARGVAWLAAVSCARVSADCACACMPASTRRWAGTQLLVRLGATGLEAPQIMW